MESIRNEQAREIPFIIVTEGLERFVRRLPDGSVSYIMSGLFDVADQACDRARDDLKRTLSDQGCAIVNYSPNVFFNLQNFYLTQREEIARADNTAKCRLSRLKDYYKAAEIKSVSYEELYKMDYNNIIGHCIMEYKPRICTKRKFAGGVKTGEFLHNSI